MRYFEKKLSCKNGSPMGSETIANINELKVFSLSLA